MIRLVPDHSVRVRRTAEVLFTFDGTPVGGRLGESIAAALMREGHRHLRDAPADGAPRGAFCYMGLCQECLVRIDGMVVESCRHAVVSGLTVLSLKQARHARSD